MCRVSQSVVVAACGLERLWYTSSHKNQGAGDKSVESLLSRFEGWYCGTSIHVWYTHSHWLPTRLLSVKSALLLIYGRTTTFVHICAWLHIGLHATSEPVSWSWSVHWSRFTTWLVNMMAPILRRLSSLWWIALVWRSWWVVCALCYSNHI